MPQSAAVGRHRRHEFDHADVAAELDDVAQWQPTIFFMVVEGGRAVGVQAVFAEDRAGGAEVCDLCRASEVGRAAGLLPTRPPARRRRPGEAVRAWCRSPGRPGQG